MTEENRTLDDKFALRLPKTLKEQIAERAKLNNRSTNAEMVARLERTMHEDEAQQSKVFGQSAPSPVMRLERRLLALEIRLSEIEEKLK